MSSKSLSNLPAITFVIATYNADKTLIRCLESFFQQTYKNKSLVIIDGGSTDNTIEIIKKYQHLLAYWISEPDKGIYNAWNKGLQQVSGDWVAFMGADDYLTAPNVLESMAKILTNTPSHIRLVYADVMVVNERDEPLLKVGLPWHIAKRKFKQLMSIPHPGAMHRLQLFTDHGDFDEKFLIAGDYEFLLRELKRADAAYCDGLTIVTMQHGGVSSNPFNTIRQLVEVRQAQIKNGIKFPGILWIFALLKAWLRACSWQILGEDVTRKLMDVGRRISGKSSFWTRVK